MGLYIGKMDRKWLSRVLIIMLADILGILGSYLLALWARFDLHFMDIPPEFLQGYLSTIWWWVLICLAVFWLCNLYNSIWRFVSVDALMRIILAYVILGGLSFGCVKLFHIVMPRSYYVWGLLCSFFITAGIRFFYRGVRYLRNRVPGSQKGTENVMIIGAGQAGRQLIREYAVSSHLNSRVACLIDDNPAKRGRILEGVRIVGGRRDIPQAVKRYDIQMELRREHPELTLDVCIGSVRDRGRVDDLLDTYQPDLIFHAAAHKHVPLMEDSPNEAIKNNVFGTYNMAQSAAAHGVKRFVLISTDKAVNPTNIMGASKRLCEMVVQMMDRRSDTEFVAVRFGNVLGSNGSVVPLFERQIACGGPVTVTHPEITRFFMTIPEAVSLVLQAGYYARGGEIFVLDMGQPVKIDDMARQLIRLSGFEPDVDIPIIYTGLRPGEKLYEELLMDEEGLQDTANRLIHVGRPIDMDDEAFCRQLEALERACRHNSPDIRRCVADMVPTYHPKKD